MCTRKLDWEDLETGGIILLILRISLLALGVPLLVTYLIALGYPLLVIMGAVIPILLVVVGVRIIYDQLARR